MENPYQSPAAAAPVVDVRRRPIGVAILSVLTGLLGLAMLAFSVYFVANWRETNAWAVEQRIPPSIFWFFCGVTIVLAIAGSVGMWRGLKWGWWIACTGLVMYVLQYVYGAVMVNLSNGPPSLDVFLSLDSLKNILRALFFMSLLNYWLRTKVRRYFGLEKTSKIKAVILSAVCGVGITTVITAVLQFIYLMRTR